jgi:hypothetical protein
VETAFLQGAELCDDGNTENKDDCTATCVPRIDKSILSMDAADVNADGIQDLVVVDGKRVLRVLLGAGSAVSRRSARSPSSPPTPQRSVADFNGDGLADIAAPPKKRRDGSVVLYANDGLGNLVPATIPGPGIIGPLLAGDFDHNGFTDLLAVQTSKPKGLAILSGDLTGPLRVARPLGLSNKSVAGFAARRLQRGRLARRSSHRGRKENHPHVRPFWFRQRSIQPHSPDSHDALGTVTIADVDQDQHQDIVACNQDKIGGCRVLYGSGFGGFGCHRSLPLHQSGREVRGAAAADFDGDGGVDLAGRQSAGRSTRHTLPRCHALQRHSAHSNNPSSLDVADFNADGRQDLVAINAGSQDISIFTNLGNRQFSTLARIKLHPDHHRKWGFAVRDANRDGRPDIAVVQSASNHLTLLLNTGAGFAALPTLTTGAQPLGVAIGDLNGDDLFDLVTANHAANTASVFLSTPAGDFTRTDIASGGQKPWAVVAPDLSGDNLGDVVILNETTDATSHEGSLVTYVNDGTGAFPALTEKHVRGRDFPRICVAETSTATAMPMSQSPASTRETSC